MVSVSKLAMIAKCDTHFIWMMFWFPIQIFDSPYVSGNMNFRWRKRKFAKKLKCNYFNHYLSKIFINAIIILFKNVLKTAFMWSQNKIICQVMEWGGGVAKNISALKVDFVFFIILLGTNSSASVYAFYQLKENFHSVLWE